MNNEQFSGLISFLTQAQALSHEQVPDALRDTDLVTDSPVLPSCQRDSCTAEPVDSTAQNGIIQYRCANGHSNEVNRKAVLDYQIDHDTVFAELADYLGLSLAAKPNTRSLPKYATAETKEGLDIALVYQPRRYKTAVQEVARRALEETQPTVFLTPHEEAREALNLFEEFPLGPLVCPLPLQLVRDDQALAREMIQAPLRFHETRDLVQEEQNIEFADVSDNPLHVAAQLHYLRTLRENKEFTKADTKLFERVCKAAFAMMFTVYRGRGGQESEFEKVPDLLYKIDGDTDRGSEPILGVTDAKSSQEARFYTEKIDRKHKPYLDRAYRYADSTYRGFRVAHTFIVFDVAGHQEIDFYRAIRDEVYANKSLETTMVVWHADALAYAYGLYLMADVVNELKLSVGSFTEALRPFFDSSRFSDPDTDDIRDMYRLPDQQDYIDDYTNCEDLIVVTLDMVQTHFEDLIQNPHKAEVEHVLKAYFLD